MGRLEIENALVDCLENAVLLDGDKLFHYGRENVHHYDQRSDGALVMDTLLNILKGHLNNSNHKTIIFGWGMHLEETHKRVLDAVADSPCKVFNISLVCNEETVLEKTRLALLKERKVWDKICDLELQTLSFRTMNRLQCYELLSTIKIDISGRSPEEVADYIRNVIL